MKYTATFLFISITCILIVLIVLINTINYNALSNQFNFRKEVFTYSPQGWAFFTRNAREAQVVLYTLENNKISAVNKRHSDVRNFFGLSRATTRVFSELMGVKSKLPNDAFSNIKYNYLNPPDIGIDTLKVHRVKNNFKNKVLTGAFLLVIQEPVPWAWARSVKKVQMPAKVVKLFIE